MKKLTVWSAVPLVLAALLIGLGVPTGAQAQSISIQQLMQMPPGAWSDVFRGLSAAEQRALHQQFSALPESQRTAFLSRGRVRGRGPTAGPPPTLQYDTGTPSGFRLPISAIGGNQFNSGFGNPHTLSTATFQMGGTFGVNFLQVFGAPAGSMAPLLLSQVVPTGGLNTLISTPLVPTQTNMSGTFMVGVLHSATGPSSTVPNPTWRNIALDTISGGFGFHVMSIAPGGTGGFNPAPPCPPAGGPCNAIMRVTGNNLPVELMDFGVEP